MVKGNAFRQEEHGQTVVEYGLLVGLVTLVVLGPLAGTAPTWLTPILTKVTGIVGTI